MRWDLFVGNLIGEHLWNSLYITCWRQGAASINSIAAQVLARMFVCKVQSLMDAVFSYTKVFPLRLKVTTKRDTLLIRKGPPKIWCSARSRSISNFV